MNDALMKKGVYFQNTYIPYNAIVAIYASYKGAVVQTTDKSYIKNCETEENAKKEVERLIEKYEGRSISDNEELLNE